MEHPSVTVRNELRLWQYVSVLAALSIASSALATSAARNKCHGALLTVLNASKANNTLGAARHVDQLPKTALNCDYLGVPLVHVAIAADKPRLISALVKRGADPNQRDGAGTSPWIAAVQGNRIASMDELLKLGTITT